MMPRADEIQLHAPPIRPFIEHLAFELRAMIHRDRQGQATQIGQSVEHRHDATTRDRGIDLDRGAFAAAVVHDCQTSKLSAVAQSVGDEVHRPAEIDGGRSGQRLALEKADSLAFSPPHSQPRFAVEPVDALATLGASLAGLPFSA